MTVVSTISIRIGTVGTETIRIETVSMAVECDSSFGISLCFGFSISRSFVDLRDTVGGGRGRNVLVA